MAEAAETTNRLRSGRIQNIGITSSRYEAALTFYRDTLGFPVMWSSDSSCFLRAGDVFLVLVDAAKSAEFAPTGRGIWLDIYVDDVAKLRSILEAANVDTSKTSETDHGYLMVIEDPDGNFLEFVQPKQQNES